MAHLVIVKMKPFLKLCFWGSFLYNDGFWAWLYLKDQIFCEFHLRIELNRTCRFFEFPGIDLHIKISLNKYLYKSQWLLIKINIVQYLNLTFFHKVVQKDYKKLSLKTVNVALIRKQKSRVSKLKFIISSEREMTTDVNDSGDNNSGNTNSTKRSHRSKIIEDYKTGNQVNGNQANGNQANGNQVNRNQANDNQANGNQADGNQANGNPANGNQANGNQMNGNQANGNQANSDQANGDQANTCCSVVKEFFFEKGIVILGILIGLGNVQQSSK